MAGRANCTHAWFSASAIWRPEHRKVMFVQSCTKCGACRALPVQGREAIRLMRKTRTWKRAATPDDFPPTLGGY